MDLKRSMQRLHFVCLFVEAQSQCRQSVKHQCTEQQNGPITIL